MANLTILIGPPGAGKSTWARNSGKAVVSTDGWRESGGTEDYGHVLARAYKEIHQRLAAGEDVVFDTPASNPDVRKAARTIARRMGATVSACVLDTPLKDCFTAQIGREHPVPLTHVARMHRNISGQILGLQTEGFDDVKIIKR